MTTSFLLAKGVIGIVFLLDLIGLIVTFATGDFFGDGKTLLSLPWGIFTFIDLYSMFLLFVLWMSFRNQFGIFSLVHLVATFLLGCVYCYGTVLYLLFESSDDWEKFFLGRGNL